MLYCEGQHRKHSLIVAGNQRVFKETFDSGGSASGGGTASSRRLAKTSRNHHLLPGPRTHSPGPQGNHVLSGNFQLFSVPLQEQKLTMNQSDLNSMLSSAEFDFERRFDERWALGWMQENWWVQGGQWHLFLLLM